MKYTVPAIKTKYKGVFYRSKLEAVFAHFLDSSAVFIECEYEPLYLNGYLPDFIGFSTATQHYVLIEIKPTFKYIDIDKYIKYIGSDTLVILFENDGYPAAIVINCDKMPLQDWLNIWFSTDRAKRLYLESKKQIYLEANIEHREPIFFDYKKYFRKVVKDINSP